MCGETPCSVCSAARYADSGDARRSGRLRRPGAPVLSEAELAAAVEEADAHGTHVAAHAHGTQGIVNAASYGVAWVDIYLLAAFKPDSDVGIYSLAYQIFSFVTQLATCWLVAALPDARLRTLQRWEPSPNGRWKP